MASSKTYPFWDTLCDNGNGLNLRELHQLHGRAVDGTGRGEVDDGVDVRVLGHGLCGVLVDGKQSLASTPVPKGLLDSDNTTDLKNKSYILLTN